MQSKCRARACKLLQLSTMSSTEALSAGPSSSDVAIAELLRGMCQMQEELRVVRQVQEETTQQLSLQAHKDNFLFKKRGNECQFNIQVVDRLAVVSSCLDRVEAANAGGGGGGGGGRESSSNTLEKRWRKVWPFLTTAKS